MNPSRRVRQFWAIFAGAASIVMVPALLTAVTTDSNKWWIVALSVLGAVLLSAIVAWLVQPLWERRILRVRTVLTSSGPERPRAGLVLTASTSPGFWKGPESTLHRCLDHVRPNHVLILGTKDTNGEEAFADSTEGRREQFATVREAVGDAVRLETGPYDEAVRQFLADLDLNPSDVVVNVTGGTVPMSLSAFLVASQRALDVEYVNQDGQFALMQERVEAAGEP